MFFCDAAHFVLAPFLCRLWYAVRSFIKASAGRNRINVLGEVNAITKEVITMTNTTYIDSNVLIELLKMIKQKFADKPIAIVLDNARYQHYYENPNRFHEAVQTFFSTLTETYKPELMSLFSLKFQFFDKKDSLIYPL